MIRVALIDSSCCLTALPTAQEFQENDYLTKEVAAIACEVEDSLVPEIWANRYNSYVLPAGYAANVLPVDAFKLVMDLNTQPPTLTKIS